MTTTRANSKPPSSAATKEEGKTNRILLKQSKGLIVLFIIVASAFSLHHQARSVQLFASSIALNTETNGTIINASTVRQVPVEHYGAKEDEADYIIRRSYEKSYAHILPCDPNITSRECLIKSRDFFNSPNATQDPSSPSIPWWFQTLLRDLPTSGAYGAWHHFTTADPQFHFCTIAKVGTTEWRKVFHSLNADECGANSTSTRCIKRRVWNTKEVLKPDAPKAVFVRDPLERLLSAYLDKCDKPNVRKQQKHCEPNIVWNPESKLKDKKGQIINSLIDDLEGKDKQMFAAYVDTFPLKWNLHFIPQAMICDLYRKFDTFGFVGNMGKDFMKDLDRMANQLGGKLPMILQDSFNYQTLLREERENYGKDNNSHSTHAPEKVARFYTAATVRRALEYLSIDYVILRLDVPDWARLMLLNDL